MKDERQKPTARVPGTDGAGPQWSGDERSDIYALGVMLYHLLTGRKPVGTVEMPGQLGLSKSWDPILTKCMEEHAAERYPSVAALAADVCKLRLSKSRRGLMVVAASLAVGAVVVVAGAWWGVSGGVGQPPRPGIAQTRGIPTPIPPAGTPTPTPAGPWRVVGKNAQGLDRAILTLPGEVEMAFLKVPAGLFTMGSPSNEADRESDEGPQHPVNVSSFWLAETETTQAQWVAVVGSNPSHSKGDTLPVEQVSWNDCQGFVQKLNALGAGGRFRLPSEAEWEYACRAGSTTRFCFGDGDGQLGEYAWYKSNSGSETHAVKQKRANAWGLYDMHGNVWEWCEDWYHDSYSGAPADGSAWISPTGSYRVRRGGDFYDFAYSCRSAYRYSSTPGYRSNGIGLRLARTLDEATSTGGRR